MASGKILLVHPFPAESGEVAAMLGSFDLLEAADAREAVEMLRSEPGIAVMAVAHGFLHDPPLARAAAGRPDVMLIAFATGAEVTACLAALRGGPLSGFVRIPIREGELLQAVEVALRRRALHGEMEALAARLEAPAGNPGSPGAAARATDAAAESADAAHPSNEQERYRDDAVMAAAHDLRSPLSVIVGYSEVLLESEPGLSERGRKTLDRIGVTGKRLLSLVNQILDLALIESGGMVIEYSETRLSELVREAVETLAGMIEEKGVVLTVDVSGDERVYLLDQNRVLQALQNILSNAVKFSPDGGSVTVTCKGTIEEVAFSVSDQGVGMDETQQAAAFEKFSRFAAGQGPGSGLGLAISRAAVEQHGGRIRVESEPGKGATFHFTVVPGQG